MKRMRCLTVAGTLLLMVNGLTTSACLRLPGTAADKSSPGAGGKPSAASDRSASQSFRVGDKVETYYAASWYPGTIVEIGSGKLPYKVRYDDTAYGESWQSAERLRPYGQKLSTAFTLNSQDTFGTWSVATATATTREEGDAVYRDYHLSGAGGTLTINADGTYSWALTDQDIIRGYWEKESNPTEYQGPVILPNGLNGHKWWVCYSGRTETGRDSIYLKSEQGTSWSGFKR